jgi:hypothetical protein
MARHRSHKRRSHSKARTQRMAQRGGELAGNPPSAWGWGLGTMGNGWQQFMNSLSLQPGQSAANQSNNIVPANSVRPPMSSQAGGRRRRARRGGNWAAVASQAAVPAALIVMNNAMGKRSRRHSRRR